MSSTCVALWSTWRDAGFSEHDECSVLAELIEEGLPCCAWEAKTFIFEQKWVWICNCCPTNHIRFFPLESKHGLVLLKTSVAERMAGTSVDRFETDHRASMLTVTGGLESDCCGEERTTGGIPLAGLVPGPLPPANWQTSKERRI